MSIFYGNARPSKAVSVVDETPIPQLPTVFPTPIPTRRVRPTRAPTSTRPFLPTFTPTPGVQENPLQNTENIILLGSDRRGGKGTGRTDVMIVAAIDREQHRVALVSLPRDLYVNVPGVGQERLNTADVYGERRKPGGGIDLVKKTIETNLSIPIHKFVRVDFGGFEQVVDTLGGITVTMDCPLHETWRDPSAPGGSVQLDFDPGDHALDGKSALWYVRTRRHGNDLDRARRQQRVLLALKNRATEVDLLPHVPALFDALRTNIGTDLNLFDVISLAQFAIGIKTSDIHSRVFDFKMGRPYTTPSGAMVLLPDQAAIYTMLEHIWDAPDIITSTDRGQQCP